MATNDHKRYRSITKSSDENIQIQTSSTNRMKRKTLLTNSEEIIHTTTKKLDVVKSIEFEPKTQKSPIEPDEFLINLNDNYDRENDFDDYADRIFNYLGEACTQQSTSSLAQVEINQIDSSSPSSIQHTSENEIKPFLCNFCPYFAQNLQEFQTHIAKHTEKNFRCLLCSCMYKYRRDCVTHMKRKHSNTVTGSISQYIQKINDTIKNSNNNTNQSSIPINSNLLMESKRYGCPYCSLMTKSTSSIYKHQSRKHASFPKIVHKYSTDDLNTRSLIAILKQKSIKNDESLNPNDLPDPSNISSSSSSLVNRHRCAASKHITSHNIPSSNGRQSKIFQCCLCGYRAQHRSNVVRHVKKIHTNNINETTLVENLPMNQSNETSPNYSFNTIVQAPIIPNNTNEQSNKSYADIHLSINIFLPKKIQQNSLIRTTSDCSDSEDKPQDFYSDEDTSDNDVHISSSHQQNSLYKPHKCCRCFYRSNWKTDMLHHIRLKHHINHPTKSDYISMDFDSALNSFTNYEKTFGKVLKNRLLLPKIDYIDCTWDELKSKLFLHDEFKKLNQQCLSSFSPSQETIINNDTMNNEENKKNLFIDNNQ